MSGLASFFRSFLPSKDGEKENYDYQESIANVVSKDHIPPPDSPPVDPKKQRAKDWKDKQNEALRAYMEKRMIRLENDEDDEDEMEDSQEYIVPDNDEVFVPFWDDQVADSQPTDTSFTSPPIRRKKIPHVDQTMEIANTLSALDLYVKEFHLSLGLVENVWALRALPRREWKASSHFEDDGPLGTLFKQVVCIEVAQLQQHVQINNLAQAAFQARSPQRLKIFFYNKYAIQVSEFLENQLASRVLLSLENVPAKCILPLNVQDFSWYDREGLAPFCLCIGDKSSMRLEQDGMSTKISFDVPGLKVTMARVNGDEVTEVDLTPESVRVAGESLPKEKDTLETAFQEWEKQRKEREEQKEEEQEAEADAGASANNTRRADSANGGRATKKARTEDTYHNLSEMRGLYEARNGGVAPMVNLYATVLGFSSPTLTKGYDWMLNVTLVDESLPLPDMSNGASDEAVKATTIVIFCRQREDLPKVCKAGDVLRLHRVGIQEWKEEIQLVGRRASSYVVVRPKDTSATTPQDEWEIVPTARGGIIFDQSDRERASELWKWAQKRLAEYPTIHMASEKLTIAKLARQDDNRDTEEQFGDLTVMVSAILPVHEALKTTTTPMGYLRVWDGTGAPESDRLPIASAGAAEAIRRGEPPPEALQAIANAIECINARNDQEAALSLEPPTCLCGRVTNVAVWEEPDWDLVSKMLQVGTFIRLRNVHEGSMFSGLKCLMVSAKSALTPLPSDTYEIKEMLKSHQQRIARNDPFNPQSGVLPLDGEVITGEAQEPAQVAMEVDEAQQEAFASIARCISEAAPSSFKVKFQITGTIPSAGVANGLRCLCHANKYKFAVNVNDETAAIDALVPDEVGEVLFGMNAAAACELSTPDAVSLIQDVTSESNVWIGEIRTFGLNGSRYFILDSVEAVQGPS